MKEGAREREEGRDFSPFTWKCHIYMYSHGKRFYLNDLQARRLTERGAALKPDSG